MRQFYIFTILTLACFPGCRHPLPVVPEQAALAIAEDDEAYAGLVLRATADNYGALVSWVYPGPLQGTGFRSPYMNRGDILLSVNDRIMTPDRFADLVAKAQPGDEVRMKVIRTEGRVNTALPEPGSTQQSETFTIRLGHKSQWTGPIDTPRPVERFSPESVLAELPPSPYRDYIRAKLREHGLEEPVNQLLELFATTQSKKNGYNTLSHVNAAFRDPESLPEIARRITDPLTVLQHEPQRILALGARNLDVPFSESIEPWPVTTPERLLEYIADAHDEARAALQRAFKDIDPDIYEKIPENLAEMMESLNVMSGDSHAKIQSLRASMDVDFEELFKAAAAVAGILLAEFAEENLPTGAGQPVPRELRHAVQGPIHAALNRGGRWFIIGGSGPNVYDMRYLDAVIDPGGDDIYEFPKEAFTVKTVFDAAGNDIYRGYPGYACLGVTMIVDQQGNDRYEGKEQSLGSAAMGISILLDRQGADVYRGTHWSMGAGFYGMGVLLDLGKENDVYWAETASQGIGGPRGFGLLFDAAGNDLYRANGPKPSAYGVPATFYGLSQGVAFGFRGYDSGGIGVLLDLNGNDRYEAGEFSQGGGYYWGMGILDDRRGNDLYYGDRYSQGFGCHQAMGVLMDHQGDDTYWSMLAANQGGAWDIGMGLLLDFQGNDSYRADGLAQGAAAMQGIAWLLDLDGTDHYVAGRGAVHGQSSSNTYHYDATGCMSWSLFIDAGGGDDFYSSDTRHNNQILTTGEMNTENRARSTLHGLFIDTDEKFPP